MIGKTFLRLERDFDKHVIYCRDEPNAQEFLQDRKDVREYFQVSTNNLFDFINRFLSHFELDDNKFQEANI